MKSLVLSLLLATTSIAIADVPSEQKPEVEHLLKFVGETQCIMTRNGSEHTGEVALKHIVKKYDYFRDDIESTEDFIKYSATKSTLSGRYYTIQCQDQEKIRTKDWLLDELAVFREMQQAENNTPSM